MLVKLIRPETIKIQERVPNTMGNNPHLNDCPILSERVSETILEMPSRERDLVKTSHHKSVHLHSKFWR